MLQFARLGTEAVVIGLYGAIIAGLVASRIGNPILAAQVAAGLPGHADDYISAFATGQIAILIAVVIGLVATVIVHMAVRRQQLNHRQVD